MIRNSVNIGKLHVFYKITCTYSEISGNAVIVSMPQAACPPSETTYESSRYNSLLRDPWEHQREVYCLKVTEECSNGCDTAFVSPSKHFQLAIILGGGLENSKISLSLLHQKNRLFSRAKYTSDPTTCCFGNCGNKT